MDRREFLKGAAAAAAVATIPGCGLDTKSLRTVEVYDKGLWVEGTWHDIKADTIFRLREPDGTIADQGTPAEICIANRDAQWAELPNGKWTWVADCENAVIITIDHPCAGRVKVYDTSSDEPLLCGSVYAVDLRNHTMLQPTTRAVFKDGKLNLEQSDPSDWMPFSYIEIDPPDVALPHVPIEVETVTLTGDIASRDRMGEARRNIRG